MSIKKSQSSSLNSAFEILNEVFERAKELKERSFYLPSIARVILETNPDNDLPICYLRVMGLEEIFKFRCGIFIRIPVSLISYYTFGNKELPVVSWNKLRKFGWKKLIVNYYEKVFCFIGRTINGVFHLLVPSEKDGEGAIVSIKYPRSHTLEMRGKRFIPLSKEDAIGLLSQYLPAAK